MSMSVSTITRLHIVFAWMVLDLMSLLITSWIGWTNADISSDFLARWAYAFVLTWPATFTIMLITALLVQRLTQRLVMPSPMQP